MKKTLLLVIFVVILSGCQHTTNQRKIRKLEASYKAQVEELVASYEAGEISKEKMSSKVQRLNTTYSQLVSELWRSEWRRISGATTGSRGSGFGGIGGIGGGFGGGYGGGATSSPSPSPAPTPSPK